MEQKEDKKENLKKQNEEIKKQLIETENYWNKTIDETSKKLLRPVQEVIQLQAEVISLRQILSEEIKSISYQIYKSRQMMKEYEKERLEFYLTGYQVKTSGGEKTKMIEADLSLYQYRVDIFDVHVNFLRETQKNIDYMNYGIKNKITLLELTEIE
jgi:hypothetical protein